MIKECECNLCEAKRRNCHSLELFWGIDSIESYLFRLNKKRNIWDYEQDAIRLRPEWIKVAAYYLWEKSGKIENKDKYFYFEAEKTIKGGIRDKIK